MKAMFHDEFSVPPLKAAINPHEKLFGAFNPMNLILLANQFELKLFIRLGPNKNSGGLFSSAKKFSRKKKHNKPARGGGVGHDGDHPATPTQREDIQPYDQSM